MGGRVRRVDADEKVRGDAVYGVDLDLPGMLSAGFLRAGIPHARIVRVDTSGAWKVPGVRAVVTGEDHPVRHGPTIKDQPALAVGKVRYAGEIVAAVAAETREAAEEAKDRIIVEYDPLPVIGSLEAALAEDTVLLHERPEEYERVEIPGIRLKGIPDTNILYHFKLRKGSIEQGWGIADVVVEREFRTQFVQYAHLEPHSAIARFDPDGSLTVWEATMGPHTLRAMLADFLGLPLSKVRVVTPLVGGGFGAKLYLRAINPVVTLLARQVPGRAVRAVFEREDEFFTSPGRIPVRMRIRTGATRDGVLVARELEAHWDQGAYADLGAVKVRNAGYAALGPYRIPHARVDGYLVYTNRQPGGAFRGLGVPQMTWAGEQQMDDLAHELGLDPVEFRKMNLLGDGDVSVTGEAMEDVATGAVLDAALAASRRWPTTSPSRPGAKVGRGVAVASKSTLTPTVTSASVRMNGDGSVEVMTAAVEHGQGSRTVLTQMVAQELSLPMERVRISPTDTSIAPFDRSSTSSRTTFSMGNAVSMAAREVKSKLLVIASDVLEASVDDLVLEEGMVWVKGSPEVRLSYQRLLSTYFKGPSNVIGEGEFGTHKSYITMDPESAQSGRPTAFWAYGSAVAEVEVDEETGEVLVRRLAVAVDAGRAINPLGCEQQLTGSAVMGLGMALMEVVEFSEGVPLNPSFLDYKVPTSLDVPPLDVVMTETPDRNGPYGARGVGEIGMAPVPAAIGNAVFAATGRRLTELPMRAASNYSVFKEGTA